MKLTLAEPKYFKDSIMVISDLVNKAQFKVTKDSLEMTAMDPANVAMVIFKLLSSCFSEYNVSKDTTIAVDLTNLKQILRRVKPEDVLTLELDSENKLKVHLKGSSSRTFLLPLIAQEDKEQKMPDLNFPVTITTEASLLNDAVEDVDIVAESVSFNVDAKKFEISGEGDLTKAHIEIEPSDNTKIVTDSNDKIKSKYSIEYLKKMIPASKITDNVVIQFNKDYPLKLVFKVIDKMQLSFILAPRVEND